MSNKSIGMTRRLREDIKATMSKGFSLIRNLMALKVPNLTVYNLDKRSGLDP